MLKDDFKSLLYKIDIISIGRSKILKLIDAIRASNPDSKFIYKNGRLSQRAIILIKNKVDKRSDNICIIIKQTQSIERVF